MNNKKLILMYLNVAIHGTDRDIDIHLADEDLISIVYYSNFYCDGNESQSTAQITFKELFYLIEENKNAERLYLDLNSEREENTKLKKTIESLENQLNTLKSAIDIIKK